MKMLERIWVILLVLGSASSVAAETHRFDPELGYQTYKVREPVLRVQPGDIVETRTLFSPLFVQREGAWPGEVGPIYIEGSVRGLAPAFFQSSRSIHEIASCCCIYTTILRPKKGA